MPLPTKIPKCPDPTEPGTYLCRRRKGAGAFLAKVERDHVRGCLTVWGSFGLVPISEFGTDAKWWGPIELKR